MEISAVSGAGITRNALVLITHAVSRLKGKGKGPIEVDHHDLLDVLGGTRDQHLLSED